MKAVSTAISFCKSALMENLSRAVLRSDLERAPVAAQKFNEVME